MFCSNNSIPSIPINDKIKKSQTKNQDKDNKIKKNCLTIVTIR